MSALTSPRAAMKVPFGKGKPYVSPCERLIILGVKFMQLAMVANIHPSTS
jgi:hypothetical protein